MLLPLCVLATATAWLVATPEQVLSERASRTQQELAKADPLQVAVIGNSTAEAAVDPMLLAQRLGLPRDNVQVLFETGSRAPGWYALLDNRVYGDGHEPDLVLVISEYRWLVETSAHSDEALRQIQDHLGPDPGVVGELTFGRDDSSPWVRNARQKAGVVRSGTLDAIRDRVVGWLLAEPGEQRVTERGRLHAEASMERLFGDFSSVDMSLHHRVVPVVEVERETISTGDNTPPVAEGYVPELVDLAAEHGSTLVFVRVPLPTSNAIRFAVDNEERRATVALLNESGAGFVDLSELDGISDASFADGVHLDPRGQKTFTQALAGELLALGALGRKPLAKAELPEAPPEVERLGEAVPVEAGPLEKNPKGVCSWQAEIGASRLASDAWLGRRGFVDQSPLEVRLDGEPLPRPARYKDLFELCEPGFLFLKGKNVDLALPEDTDPSAVSITWTDTLPLTDNKGRQGWWVYPGTSVRFTFPEPVKPKPEGLEATVTAVAFSEATGVPTVSLDDNSAPLRLEGDVWQGEVLATAARQIVTVTSPPDGPLLMLAALQVDGIDGRRFPVAPSRTGPSELVFVGSGASALPVYASPPPAVPLPRIKSKGGMSSVDLDGFAAISPAAVGKITSKPCSALVVSQGGEPLPRQGRSCKQVRNKPGSACHEGNTVAWRTKGPGKVSVDLEPTRQCRTSQWLYPGDIATVDLTGKQVVTRPVLLRSLDVEAVGLGDGNPDALVTVRLVADGRKVLEEAVPLSKLADRLRWRLPRPLQEVSELQLMLATGPEAPYVLVSYAGLLGEG